jgi:probable DNA repair protein
MIELNKTKNKEALFEALAAGAIVITPNNRLSSQLLQDFFKTTTPLSKISEVTCLPYKTFLQHWFKKLRHQDPHRSHPILLSQAQQDYLWQQILVDYNAGFINEVKEAWRRCALWQIDSASDAFALTPQTQHFQRFSNEFKQQLQKLHALTEEQLVGYLLNSPPIDLPFKLIWACFDDYTPEQQALQNAMQQRGCVQEAYDLGEKHTEAYRYAAKDKQDEYRQMIEWAKEQLNLKKGRIAIVIPELQKEFTPLQRLLKQHLSSEAFNISLGQPFIEYPIVAHALHWLDLDKATLDHHQIKLLLTSPYLSGSHQEFITRSELMQKSTLLKHVNLSFYTFIKATRPTAPLLAACLENIADYPHEASPMEWVHYFKTRLLELGFPGEYTLQSANYQCFQRLMMLLDEFLQLALISPIMTKKEALAALNHLAKSTIFQTQKATTSLQILGLLEASGCTFDSIWVSGLTDQCLPQKANLSAFIPIHLQRERSMPHASAERELQLAEQLVARLQYGCEHVVFSYPQLMEDMPNLPSPLIKPFKELPKRIIDESRRETHLMTYQEDYLVPFALNESISGGTALLAYQAQCPFRAFAAHRLHAEKAVMIVEGLDVIERGSLIHNVLDLLWQRLKSQHYLLSLSDGKLQEEITHAIEQALKPIIQESRRSFSSLIRDVEILRLTRLVEASLAWEKKRPPFIVESTEQHFTIQLGGIDFRLRVDRLDEVDGKKWVIDYKSSLPSASPWNEERPEAPQLLLYALLDEQINALLFLQLKGGRVACSGFSENKVLDDVKSLKPDEEWADYRERWQHQLTELACEFKKGHCPPEPQRRSTCQQCDFTPLCRVGLME